MTNYSKLLQITPNYSKITQKCTSALGSPLIRPEGRWRVVGMMLVLANRLPSPGGVRIRNGTTGDSHDELLKITQNYSKLLKKNTQKCTTALGSPLIRREGR